MRVLCILASRESENWLIHTTTHFLIHTNEERKIISSGEKGTFVLSTMFLERCFFYVVHSWSLQMGMSSQKQKPYSFGFIVFPLVACFTSQRCFEQTNLKQLETPEKGEITTLLLMKRGKYYHCIDCLPQSSQSHLGSQYNLGSSWILLGCGRATLFPFSFLFFLQQQQPEGFLGSLVKIKRGGGLDVNSQMCAPETCVQHYGPVESIGY